MSRKLNKELYTWQSFIAFAESYGQAAFYTSKLQLLHDAPIGALACHSMELALKAVLLARGATAASVRDYSHDLVRLFRDSGIDWSDIDRRAIGFYAQAVLKQGFRYRDSRRPYMFDANHALTMMEKVFHRCLEAVSPGARRSLRSDRMKPASPIVGLTLEEAAEALARDRKANQAK